MKTISHLIISLLLTFQVNSQEQSKISKVTVYLDGAEINRTAKVYLQSGTTEITFNKLSPYIDESSIQISGLNGASILSINYGINYLSKQKQTDSIVILKGELKIINAKIQEQNDLISGFNEEMSLIQSNKRLGNETEVVNLDQLKAFASYYRKRITELKQAINSSNSKIRGFELGKSDVVNQLNEFNVDEKVQTGEIKLKLNTNKPKSLSLKISYNIKEAGWFPIYDLKSNEINKPIKLEYKAHVYQNTGCDWSNVKLILSTGDPNTNNVKPILNPKFLNFISPYSNYNSQRSTRSYNYKYNPLVKTVTGVITSASDGLPLPGVTVIEKGTANGTQTDFDGRYTLRTSGNEELIYSYVGMDNEVLPIHSSIMNVSLNEGNKLEEVVVVGYGTSTNDSFKYSSTVYSEDIVNSLYGKAAGITIRGSNTVNGKSNLLYIVDGVPVKASAAKNINPDTIESIEVLKDSRATAIYGNRASNGVLIIKTLNSSKRKLNELGVVVETGITNTRFEIEEKYTIPSDGDITVIEIDNFYVPTKYDYFAAPVLNENVFLTAKIGNWEQYNLLPAEANIYFEGSYSGKTNINPGATTDSLTISLGVDPNIIVKRTQNKDFKKSTFIGNNKVVYKAFDIEVRNNKQTDIQLTLLDRIPLTQDRSIKLDDINTGNSQYDKEKGLLKWTIELKSGESKKVKHSYSVKYPNGKRINL
ncbi:mucoidy inhibitor MuiA family protein [Winogradskyella sp. A2]|uniref:DUF4139 domain-containing protein n=1 Tax=Winogradskyella sp. A2 TaxID=3366944 RepID=UPI00398C670C